MEVFYHVNDLLQRLLLHWIILLVKLIICAGMMDCAACNMYFLIFFEVWTFNKLEKSLNTGCQSCTVHLHYFIYYCTSCSYRSDYQQLVYSALSFKNSKIKLLKPCIVKPCELWSGKQVGSNTD